MNAVMAATKAKPNCALPVDSQCRLVHAVAAVQKHSQESFHSAASSVAYVVCFVVVQLIKHVFNIILYAEWRHTACSEEILEQL
jgi:hypothetical protein